MLFLQFLNHENKEKRPTKVKNSVETIFPLPCIVHSTVFLFILEPKYSK